MKLAQLTVQCGLLAGLTLVGGCQRATEAPPAKSATAAPAAQEPWAIEYQQFLAKVKPGMTETDVTAAVGEPKWVRSTMGGDNVVAWIYDLPSGRRMKVKFNSGGKVITAESDVSVPVQ